MTNSADRGRGRIRELDGWRGVSILLVVAFHMARFAYPEISGRIPVLNRMLANAGTQGVQIFFVVSGFVITRLLLLEEKQFGSISLKGFYIRRCFRILPVFYAVIAATSLLSRLGWTPVTRLTQMGALFFFHDLDIGYND